MIQAKDSFSAKLFGNIKDGSYTAASLIELLHTATLVHDDVIDESNFRRGVFSINALWKNKVSVYIALTEFQKQKMYMLLTEERRQ